MVDKPVVDKDEETARWFAAARRGVMLHEERSAFEQWRQDPENAARLARFEAVWRDLAPSALSSSMAPPARHAQVAHRRQLAALVALVSLTATLLTRLDGGWWNTLDWWSR